MAGWKAAHPQDWQDAVDEGYAGDLEHDLKTQCHRAAQIDINGGRRPNIQVTDKDVHAYRGRINTRKWLKHGDLEAKAKLVAFKG